jgi:hypothetical protein
VWSLRKFKQLHNFFFRHLAKFVGTVLSDKGDLLLRPKVAAQQTKQKGSSSSSAESMKGQGWGTKEFSGFVWGGGYLFSELIRAEAMSFSSAHQTDDQSPRLIKRTIRVVMGNGGAFPDSLVDDKEWEIYHNRAQLQRTLAGLFGPPGPCFSSRW